MLEGNPGERAVCGPRHQHHPTWVTPFTEFSAAQCQPTRDVQRQHEDVKPQEQVGVVLPRAFSPPARRELRPAAVPAVRSGGQPAMWPYDFVIAINTSSLLWCKHQSILVS